MTPQEHYEEAERLLEEGRKIKRTIFLLDSDRKNTSRSDGLYDRYTETLNEYTQQTLSIWAQAQAHATLATVPVRRVKQFDDSMVGSHMWWEEA